MTPKQSVIESDFLLARATGFSECAPALRRTLATTPAGWLLVLWFCYSRLPVHSYLPWFAIVIVVWAGSLMVLQSMIKAGPKIDVHRQQLRLIAALDGLAWGSLTWFLIGQDPTLDAVLMALLCGVASINAQVYGTYAEGYYGQIGAMWLASVLGLLQSGGNGSRLEYAGGMTLFIALTAYYTRATSHRLLEGIRLQHANATLTAQLRVALEKVEADAATDALTGHGNRRALDDILRQQLERFSGSSLPFSILMLDIDFFKKINDEFGHLIGDEVLRAFARVIRKFLRSQDFCTRYGGEEFVIVLPETSHEIALEVGERIRAGVGKVPLLRAPSVSITVSIGVATIDTGMSASELIAAADAAVYLSKNDGRNQVRSHRELITKVD